MVIDYSTPGKVTFSMKKYTRNITNEFPEDISKTAETPAGKHLFTLRDNDTRRTLPKK